MKKILFTITIAFLLAACNPFASQEDQDKAELKALVAQQEEIKAQINAKVNIINSYKQIDKLFDPNQPAPVRKTTPRTSNIPAPPADAPAAATPPSNP